jgi:hypothetical protein
VFDVMLDFESLPSAFVDVQVLPKCTSKHTFVTFDPVLECEEKILIG